MMPALRAGVDRFFEREDARLRWRVEGGVGVGADAGRIALVLVHGWALSLDYWNPVVPLLGAQHRLLRYDRRGFGRSVGRYDPNEAVDDLIALLDAAGIERACLVGMSQGARVAIHTAIRAPDRVSALVLDGAPWFEAETELPLMEYRRLRDTEGLVALHRAILGHPLMQLTTPGVQGARLLQQCVGTYRGDDLDGGWEPVPLPRLHAIRQPTLVLNGGEDSVQRRQAGERLRAGIRGARRVEIAGAAHLASLDQAGEWAGCVLEFAAGVKG
jgi:pimeloyl-ACP methyl ester carboxylesterase